MGRREGGFSSQPLESAFAPFACLCVFARKQAFFRENKDRSLAKIANLARTSLLNSIQFFFAPLAALRENIGPAVNFGILRPGGAGSLAKIAKLAKTSLLNSIQFFFAPFASLREDSSVSRQDR
jgi:hypothetical protein